MQVSESVKKSYSEQYDESIRHWRAMAAKYKAQNIAELAKEISFKNVLEVGSGDGSILQWLSDWNFSDDLNCLEISESGLDMIRSRNIKHLKEALLFDGYKIPYPDNHFDLVICSHVMEHVEHERVLLREIARVSKHQIFEVPIDFAFYVDKHVKHYTSYGHINIYTPALFRFLLLTENFQVLKDKCYMYDKEVMKHTMKDVPFFRYQKIRLIHAFIKMFPYLLGIKPNSYAVLTSKSDKGISIFE